MRAATARRAGWSLGDQVLASATNFGLTLIVARSVAPAGFGTFALVMAGYTLVSFLGRGMTSDPLSTRYSGVAHDEWAGGVRASLCAALGLGVVVALLAGGLALLLPSPLSGAVAAFAVVVPGVLLQDHIRFAFFTSGRARHAFVNDGIWAVAQIGGVIAVLTVGTPSIGTLVLVWGGSGALAVVIGLLQLGVRPRPSRTLWWLRSQRDLWGFYTVENALFQATNILVLAVVGWVGGLAAAGSLRAATLVFAPLTVLSLGVIAVGVPELARAGARRPSVVRTASLAIGAALAVVGAVWGLVAYALPPWLGESLLGATWDLAAPILLLTTVDAVSALFIIGPFIGLRALGSGGRSLGTRVVFGTIRLVVACTGAFLGGAPGALVGFAVVAPIQMVVWAVQVGSAATGRTAVPAGER